jgi:transposase
LHVQGQNRDQATLLPERLDDLIGDDNAVRLIDAFVDSLDLKAPGFARIETKGTGRPPYHPGGLLKLYLYGYMYRFDQRLGSVLVSRPQYCGRRSTHPRQQCRFYIV